MAVFTSAGTTIGISATAPTTLDAAGYGAVVTTAIGEVTDLGDIPSRVYEIVTHQPIAERGQKKAKGGYSLGSQTITFGLDGNDAGQILAETASTDDAAYTVEIAHPELGTIYAMALITSFSRNYGDVNTIATGSVTIEYVIPDGAAAGEDGVVIVAAA